MPLRIAFDLDGVLADMESELVRQSEILFGEQMTRRLQKRAAEAGHTPPTSAAPPAPTGSAPVPAEVAPDVAPPIARLNMTSRQQRRLWRHVESIENFW